MVKTFEPSPAATPLRLQEADGGEWRIRRDQWAGASRSAAVALPVNIVLAVICAVVGWRSGQHLAALLWLTASFVVNGARGLRYRAVRMQLRAYADDGISPSDVDRQLATLWKMTLLSGCVWAVLPALCGMYTTAPSLFFLIVGCGITSGAVSHGGAYSNVPIAFITPPILSAAVAMAYVGGFDRYALAATMLVYLAALVVTARRAEASFRNAARLTHQVIAMNVSLETANERALSLADGMRRRADHDDLTGLLNRAGFLRGTAVGLGGVATAHCVMLLDLDGFKAINDAFGHRTGDEILVEVADRLRLTLPSNVLIGRWGGDEFAIRYALDSQAAPPASLADQLIVAIAAPYSAFGAVARIGLSVGIHVSDDTELAEMLARADLALYAAKSAGRNRHHLFDDALRAHLDIRRDIERDLPIALADGSIQLWFQPIFGSAGNQVSGLEGLIRWLHPIHGWIPPAELIATAAKAGFARPLMDFILDRVCAMIFDLRERQFEHVSVAMNVSPREMAQLPVDELVLGALSTWRLPPSALEIEITEEVALDFTHTEKKISALARAGVRIVIDDFGVGYSSLSSLRTLHVDRLKIDRSFVSNLASSQGDQEIVKAVLTLGKSLRIDVVAEGVESAEDLQTLRAYGCQFMQGYHLGHAMPAVQCLDFVEQSRECELLVVAKRAQL